MTLLRPLQLARFSTDARQHKQNHIQATLHPKFFENDFVSTSIRELEYVRSPFFDLSKAEHSKEGAEASDFIEKVQIKLEMTQFLRAQLRTEQHNKDTVAFTRYGDFVADEKFKEKLQFPRGKPFVKIDAAKELFRVQKSAEHWDSVRRSKAFLADDFFPPRAIPYESNLKTLLAD